MQYLDSGESLRHVARVPSKLYARCAKFAKAIIDTKYSYYANKTRDPSKLIEDYTLGALAEFCASRFLNQKYKLPLVEPNLEVYTEAEKMQIGFDADLTYPDMRVHVKSWKPSIWRESYCFAIKDKLCWAYTENDYVALVHSDKDRVGIRAILPYAEIADKLKPPVIKKYAGIKKALYIDDLI